MWDSCQASPRDGGHFCHSNTSRALVQCRSFAGAAVLGNIHFCIAQDDAVPTKSFAQPLGSLALAIPLLFLNFRDVVTFSDGKGDSWWKLAKISRRLRQKLPEAAALGADVLYLGHIPGAPWRRCGMDEWTLRNVVATLSRKGVQCDNDWQCVSLVLGLLCKFGKSCQMFRAKKKPGLYEAEYLWTSTTWICEN